MLRFVLYRLAWVLVTVWVVATLSFFLVRAAPGDPFMNEMKNLSPAVREARKREYRLDQPVVVQYFYWLAGAVQGDFGRAMKYNSKTVNSIIAQTFPVSVALGSLALVFALVVGLTTGILAALRHHSSTDFSLMSVAVLGISLPSFTSATLLVVLFVFVLHLLPLAGWEQYPDVILPAIALGFPFAAEISRLVRVGMLEIMSEDFIRTAQAKGLRERHIVLKHALRGALLPVVSFLGPAAAAILTGSLVIERIFFIPGMGKVFIQAALNRDYNVLLGVIVVFSTLLCLFNFLVDVSYTFLDPRVKLEEKA